MKVLTVRQRSVVAKRLTALAIVCLLIIPLGALALGAPMKVLPLATLAGFTGYLYFAGRAMTLWQGRHIASLRCTDSWRRHFCEGIGIQRVDRGPEREHFRPRSVIRDPSSRLPDPHNDRRVSLGHRRG